jgi:very-short-patch-repair endonuclease
MATEGATPSGGINLISPPMLRQARELRHATTQPERTLWAVIRKNQIGLRFRREHPIGPYVLDFYCPSVHLCLEVDGPAHDEWDQIEHDAVRDAYLIAHGVQVLRFKAAEIEQRPAAVIARIRQAAPPPSPMATPPPRKRRGGSD